MKPTINIALAIMFLSSILAGDLDVYRLRNNPEFGTGYAMFVYTINAFFAIIVASNIVSAVRKLKAEPTP